MKWFAWFDKNKDEHLNWADIWILQALYVIDKGKQDFKLSELIGIGDFIQHAIILYYEYNNGLYRLEKNELIEINNNIPKLTQKSIDLINKYYDLGFSTQAEQIEKELNIKNYNSYKCPKELISEKIYVSQEDFNQAIKDYYKESGFESQLEN